LGQGAALTPLPPVADEAVEKARRLLDNIHRNYENLVVLLGEDKAQEAVAEAEANLEAAQRGKS
jgi:hypothetical protein